MGACLRGKEHLVSEFPYEIWRFNLKLIVAHEIDLVYESTFCKYC